MTKDGLTPGEANWTSVGADGQFFVEASQDRPGWYWLMRPHHAGPGRYDPENPVVCPIHVFKDGRVSSPLADFRRMERDHLVPRDHTGKPFPSLFFGPLQIGDSSGALRVERTGDGYEVEGEPPSVPGWYWCRTNSEAPLIHVDRKGIGPIYLDRVAGGAVHVWSAATTQGRPVDVGELGFSEPLTSEGGVIDASGELGRLAAEFFGAIELPPSPPPPIWTAADSSAEPALSLSRGETTLKVSDLARARVFYEKLGFNILATRPDEGWATLDGLGMRLRLVTGRGAALHFSGGPSTREALLALGMNPEPVQEGLALTDPDGHRIVIGTEVEKDG